MSGIETYIAEDLMDGEICDLYLEVARILDILQTLEKTGGWLRPIEPALHTVQRLCEVLLQRVAAVQAKTLEGRCGRDELR